MALVSTFDQVDEGAGDSSPENLDQVLTARFRPETEESLIETAPRRAGNDEELGDDHELDLSAGESESCRSRPTLHARDGAPRSLIKIKVAIAKRIEWDCSVPRRNHASDKIEEP